jgi:glycosyltransferase involved in cell wall biosynthesis
MTELRVLHVLNELKPSGMEMMLRVAARNWADVGIRPSIVSKGLCSGSYATTLRASGYPVHHLPFDAPLSFAGTWIRFLKTYPVDVLHVHTEHANFWISLLAKLAGVPAVVRTVHNVFTFEGRVRLARTLQRHILSALGVPHVSVSPSVQAAERSAFGNPSQVILNWVDDRHFVPPTGDQRRRARTDFGLSPSDFALVTVGNCAPFKNHTALLEAVALLPADAPAIYLHVGLEDAAASERARADALGIRDRVRFLGALDDVRPLLYAADVFVMPSLQEGYGLSAVEAMAAGVPVLLTDVPGLCDAGSVSSHVRWAAPTPASLADGLRAMQALSDTERRALGRALHDDVAGVLSAGRGVDAYAKVYREALGRPAPEGALRRDAHAFTPTAA